MPRELRALRQRHGLACAGCSADPSRTLSVRTPARAQTLASVATQGRCCGEEQQAVAVGVVVGKSCLKRPGSAASGGGSRAAKRVSFMSEPQVRVMSPPAVVKELGRQSGGETLPGAEVGGGERLRPRRARFVGGSSVLAGATARRFMRNEVNLGVGVEQVTVAASNSAKFEEEGDVGETVDRKRKRKSRENSEHMVVGAQIGVSPRRTRSSGLLLETTFVSPPVVEKKRARSKGPDVKEQSLEEQTAKLENRRKRTKPATRSNSYQELASHVEEEYQEQVVALCKAPPLRRSSRNHSKARGLLLNNNTSSESDSCTRAWEEGNEAKIAGLSTHNAAKDHIEEGMPKEDEHWELPSNGGDKGCAGTEEQMVQTAVRKGCLKRSGADVSSGSSGVAKKVTFKLLEHAAPEVAGFRRRPWVVADGEGDAGGSWPWRNAVNFGAGDGVENITGAVSRNISAKADEKEEDVGAVVDGKQKASENAEDIGYVWLMPIIATTNLSQIVAATKSAANKMATKVVANFGKKLSLYHMDHGANKVGQAAVAATDQVDV